ncbi:glycoside hydrolase family 27 protein [Parafilimonas sp.]|uniref:glycoside hydrolase family 27 protein n=1 Tax=Parafilimonas sp. TaxID=1969739 RepID=UPI0039E38309
MKRLLTFLFCFISISGFTQASKPPLGWNSYNCFGSAVHEDEVKANAGYMAQHLKQYGWQYIVVDFLWAYDNPPYSKIGNPFQERLYDGSYIPWLAMDEYGRLMPQATKFPSSFQNKGFKPLSDYVHSLGLKFGIHIMRGIPRQAVWAKTKVLGADGITADMIADTTSKCEWMNHMYGLDMNKKGAQEYLNSLLQLYASWDVDFIKVDDISRPYHKAEIEGYKKAIDNCGRPIVLSISPGATPVADAAHVKQFANMWRMADDFWDNWKEIIAMMNYAKQWQGAGGPGHWPDCDMLQVGKLSKRGPVGPERYSRFTDEELKTHITFWCIYQSPLMMGGNMPENRPYDDSLLMNEEVLSVDQNALYPQCIFMDSTKAIWVSHVAGSNDVNIALFNLKDEPAAVSIDFAGIGLKGNVLLRDLWQRKDLGTFKNKFGYTINAHGSLLLRASSIKK